MPEVVYRISSLLSRLVGPLPVGTNLGLYHLLWVLISGRLLESRGAVTPALAAFGLSAAAVRRALAALAYGHWEVNPVLQRWQQEVQSSGEWQPREHGGYRPVACDLIGFFRPRLKGCPTTHYLSSAGKALPAIPVGILVRVGMVNGRRFALPVQLLGADPADPRETELQQRLLRGAGPAMEALEVLLFDAGFPLSQVLAAKVPRFLGRGPQNFTARRNKLPEYPGKGRPAEYGDEARPLARHRQGKVIPATPPDRSESWVHQGRIITAHFWDDLVLATQKPGAESFHCIVIHDPHYRKPLLLLTNLRVTGAVAMALYRDRWPVEQPPLAAKQMLGAHRQFVFGSDSRQRLPELTLLAGSILTYLAATSPAAATGFWDRQPQATAGRLRRALGRVTFPDLAVPAGRIREKASPTAHLPKGVVGHRRRPRDLPVAEPLARAA